MTGTDKNNNNQNNDIEEKAEALDAEVESKQEPVTMTVSELELERLRKEAAEYKDKYQRTLAEGENARKRLQREKQELIQYALQNTYADFLNPIDHLENALKFSQQASDEVKHWAIGFQMILNQFKEVLSSNGVNSFDSEGTHFDPSKHEAIETIPTDEFPPGTVVSETLRGYKMGDRVIRPAKVKVAKAPSPKKENGEN